MEIICKYAYPDKIYINFLCYKNNVYYKIGYADKIKVYIFNITIINDNILFTVVKKNLFSSSHDEVLKLPLIYIERSRPAEIELLLKQIAIHKRLLKLKSLL